jgi:predicted kinase
MKNCIILVGPPASGKSTWISSGKNYRFSDNPYSSFSQDVVNLSDNPFVDQGDDRYYKIYSSDDIIDHFAVLANSTYNDIFKESISLAEKIFWADLRAAIISNVNIIIDRTNMTVKSRKRYIDLLIPYGYTMYAYVFPKPDEVEWRSQLNSRKGKNIPENVLQNMISSFQMPTEDEGFENVLIHEI